MKTKSKMAVEEEPRKGIRIGYERFLVGEKKMVKITRIAALSRGDLPDSYIESEHAVWLTSSGNLESSVTNEHEEYFLELNEELTWPDFQDHLLYIRKAGHNLTKIRRELAKRKQWVTGEREIVI